MRSLGGADDFSMVVSCSRVCLVRVLWVLALLDRGLAPPGVFGPAVFRIAYVLRVFSECECDCECECESECLVIASKSE